MPTVYSGAGEVEPVTLVVPFEVPVTGATITICLGYSLPSGAWHALTAPNVATIASDGMSVSVTQRIGSGQVENPIGGTYLRWAKAALPNGDVILGVCRTTAIKVNTDTGTPVIAYPAFFATINGQPPDQFGNIVLTSNIALDTDGVPFYSIGATDASIQPDTDGVPYFEAA